MPNLAPLPLLLLWRQPADPVLKSLLAVAAATARRLWPACVGLTALLSGSGLELPGDWLELLVPGSGL